MSDGRRLVGSVDAIGGAAEVIRTIVQLIAATTTEAGLTVRAELDENKYPKGVKISDAELAAVNLQRHTFYGDWNYTILPVVKKADRY